MTITAWVEMFPARFDEILAKCRNEIRMRGYSFECVAAKEGMELEW